MILNLIIVFGFIVTFDEAKANQKSNKNKQPKAFIIKKLVIFLMNLLIMSNLMIFIGMWWICGWWVDCWFASYGCYLEWFAILANLIVVVWRAPGCRSFHLQDWEARSC